MTRHSNQIIERIETLENSYNVCFEALKQKKDECEMLQEENKQLRKELDKWQQKSYLMAM